MSSLIRPATPGFLVTLTATIILAVVSFSVPLLKSVYFLKASLSVDNVDGYITFGTLGYCTTVDTTTTCSNATVGYELNVNALVGDTSIQIPQVVVKWLTYVLVLHIVAFGLAGISALFGLLAHVREMAMSCFSSCVSGFAATVALVAFIFDIALFFVAKSRMNSVENGSASIGNAVWLTLAAWVLLFFSGCVYGVGRCCLRRRQRDAWGGKAGTPIGANGYGDREQLRLDAVKAEADRKARQAQPEVGLPAFHEYDPSQPLKARIDGDEVYLEEDAPYRDNRSVSSSPRIGAYDRSRAHAGYIQAPPGTRAVDEYNNTSSYPAGPQRRATNRTHTTTTTAPSIYPPSSTTATSQSTPVAPMYDPARNNQYNHDPYSPQAYGHNLASTPYNQPSQQPHGSYDSYGAFNADTYNATAAMVGSPAQPNTGYGGAYNDPYYGHYQAPSNPTPPPITRSPVPIDTQVTGVPMSASPVRGPRGARNDIVMAPPSSVQFSDNPPTYDSGPSGPPGQWGSKN